MKTRHAFDVVGLFGFTVNSNCQKPFQFFPCQEANRLGLQPQRRLRQFLLDEGPCLLSYHVRGTEFSFLAELDVGERRFEAIAGKTAEEAKKNAAVAALQALQIEKSTMTSPAPASSLPPRHLRGRFECEACEDAIKMKFLGPEEANIHRIGQRSHAKLKVINEKEKHFVITVAGTEKRFMKATYMLQELLAKSPKSKRPKASLVFGLIDMNHRPIIALDSFHLGKMVACTLHLTFLILVFPCKSNQCNYFQYIYFVNLLDMSSNQPF